MTGMRDGMVVIPILMGCSSTLDVLNPSPPTKRKRKPKPQSADSHMISKKQEKAEESSLLWQISGKNSKKIQSFPKASIAGGIHKLIQKSSKSFSQVFVYKGHEDEDDEDNEDEYEEMVIGAPTDVEHLTHIGIGQWNSIPSTSINNILTA